MFKPVATAGGASHTEKQHTASAALSANCQLLSASRCSIVWLSGVGLPQLKLGHLLHLLNLAPLSAINPSQPPVHPKATQRGALPLPSVPFNPPTDLIVVVPQLQLPPPPLQLLPPPLPRSLGQALSPPHNGQFIDQLLQSEADAGRFCISIPLKCSNANAHTSKDTYK